jgi:hypothetical protein
MKTDGTQVFKDLTKKVINDFKLVSLVEQINKSRTNNGSYIFTLADTDDKCFVDIWNKAPDERGELAKDFNNRARIATGNSFAKHSFFLVFNYVLSENDRAYYERKIKSHGSLKFYIYDRNNIIKIAKSKGLILTETNEISSSDYEEPFIIEKTNGKEVGQIVTNKIQTEEKSKIAKIFISHSEKDELLAKELIQLFTNVSNLGPEDFICSSVEGSKIEPAADWANYIETGIDKAPLVIFLLTANFMESRASYWELGLTIGKEIDHFILMDNEITYDDIGLLAKYQVEKLNHNSALDRLKDKVEDCRNLKKIKTDAWNDRKNDFINNFNQ